MWFNLPFTFHVSWYHMAFSVPWWNTCILYIYIALFVCNATFPHCYYVLRGLPPTGVFSVQSDCLVRLNRPNVYILLSADSRTHGLADLLRKYFAAGMLSPLPTHCMCNSHQTRWACYTICTSCVDAKGTLPNSSS